MASEVAARLRSLFVQYGYKWKIGGQLQVPTEEDFDQTIDKAKTDLYDEPVPSQMEVGHLLIRHHRPGKFEIYLHLGDTND